MKNSKKIAATLLASAMMFGSATVLAAPGDLYKVSDPSKVFMSADEYMDADEATQNMISLKGKEYYIQLGDKLYKLSALRKLYATHKADYHKHLNEVPAGDVYDPQPAGDLEVIEITKIEKDKIHVNFKKLTEDVAAGAPSVTKDGKPVEMVKKELKAGADSAEFEFKTAFEKPEDLFGKWVIGGKIYIKAAFKATACVVDATKMKLEMTFDADVDDPMKLLIQVNGVEVQPEKVDYKTGTKKIVIATLKESLDKQEGILSVNGENFEFDESLPAVKEVKAIAKKTISVEFDDTLKSIDQSKFNPVALLGMPVINKQSVILQADKKTVLITLNNPMVSGKNNYALNIKEGAVEEDGFKNLKNEEIQIIFDGTKEEDTIQPVLTEAEYTAASKKLLLTFSKNVSKTIDAAKVKINTVALTDADTVTHTVLENQLLITLSDATKAEVEKLAEPLKLILEEGAVKDMEKDTLVNAAHEVEMKVTRAPEFIPTESGYDENEHVLTLKFSQKVNVADITKISVGKKGALIDLKKGDDKPVQEGDKTLKIKLRKEIQQKIQDITGDVKLFVTVKKNAVKTGDLLNSEEYANQEVKFVEDKTAPTLLSAKYLTGLNNDLTLQFSEPVRPLTAPIPMGALTFKVGDETKATVRPATFQKVDEAFLTVQFNAADVAVFNLLKNAYKNNQEIQVYLNENIVSDFAGINPTTGNNKNAKMEAIGATVEYMDLTVPAIAGGTLTVVSEKQVEVEFTTPMDSTTVNKDNITITDSTGQTIELDFVGMSEDKTKAYIKTKTAMNLSTGSGDSYTITFKGLKSKSHVIMPDETQTFDGVMAAMDTDAPTLVSVQSKTVSGYNNDLILVRFNDAADLDETTVKNADNYKLKAGATDVEMKIQKIEYNKGIKVATLTLGANLKNTTTYNLEVSNVKDVYGNGMTTPSGKNVVLAAQDAVPPTIASSKAVVKKEDDKSYIYVTLTFNEALDKESAVTKTNYTMGAADKPTSATLDATGTIVTLKFDLNGPEPLNVAVKATGVEDPAGNAMAAANLMVAIADTTPPKFAAVPILATAQKASTPTLDTIELSFNEEVDPVSGSNADNYVITVNGSVVSKDDINDITVVAKAVTIKLDTEIYVGDTVTVTASKIKDVFDNEMTESETGNTVVVAAALPAGAPATAALVGTSNKRIQVDLKNFLKEDTVTKEDFVVEGHEISKIEILPTGDKVDLILVTPIAGGSTAKVKASDSYEVKDEMGNLLTKAAFFNGDAGIETGAAGDVDAEALVGIEVADALGAANDGKTQLTLPALPVGAVKYLAKVQAGPIVIPKLGKPAAGLGFATAVNPGINFVAANNNDHIGVVAVDGSGNIMACGTIQAVEVAHVPAKVAKLEAKNALTANDNFDTIEGSLFINGFEVQLTSVKALGANYDSIGSMATVVARLQADIDRVFGAGKFTVSNNGNKLVIKTVDTGLVAEIDLAGSHDASIMLLGFESDQKAQGADAEN